MCHIHDTVKLVPFLIIYNNISMSSGEIKNPIDNFPHSIGEIGSHTATQFSDDLEAMCSLVLEMAGLVEKRLSEVIAALHKGDVKQAKHVAQSDHKVNIMEVRVDAECTKILALHQPVARDLRLVTTALKMIADLERIGDEAQKIAKQVAIIEQSHIAKSLLQRVEVLGNTVTSMLRLALDSFARLEDSSTKLHRQDQVLDDECQAVMSALLSEMSECPSDVQPLLSVIWCVRALERIGDHAKNISEYTVYLLAGKDIRHTKHPKTSGKH